MKKYIIMTGNKHNESYNKAYDSIGVAAQAIRLMNKTGRYESIVLEERVYPDGMNFRKAVPDSKKVLWRSERQTLDELKFIAYKVLAKEK